MTIINISKSMHAKHHRCSL